MCSDNRGKVTFAVLPCRLTKIQSYVKNNLAGVLSIEVGLLAERAEVVYDKRITDVCPTFTFIILILLAKVNEIIAAIEDLGFQAANIVQVYRFLM